jgi:uncharacterized protein (UPF0276 family)
MDLPGHEFDEASFLAEMARRSGCGLLVDVSNVFVSAHNLGSDAAVYLDALSAAAIGEIHLAGHSADPDRTARLLVDTDDPLGADAMWRFYAWLVDRIGARPAPLSAAGLTFVGAIAA